MGDWTDQIRTTPFAVKLDVLTQGFIIDTMVGGEESGFVDSTQEMDSTQGEEEVSKPDVDPDEPEEAEKKPDALLLLLKNTIEIMLLEEVTTIGLKMNRYRGVLSKGVLEFAEGHHENASDLRR